MYALNFNWIYELYSFMYVLQYEGNSNEWYVVEYNISRTGYRKEYL